MLDLQYSSELVCALKLYTGVCVCTCTCTSTCVCGPSQRLSKGPTMNLNFPRSSNLKP